jgi:hypothetical protein
MNVDNVEQVDALVQEERRINVSDTADKLDSSCEFVYSIIHKDFGNHKICARWVPKQFTDEHR